MAPFNRIINKKFIAHVVKDGKTVVVSAATETTSWTRTDAMAQKVGESLTKSLTKWDGKLPEGTKEICSREGDHKSDNDQREHITAVCLDENAKGTTVHVPV